MRKAIIESRGKLLLENFFIYGMGNILTKVVPFLMLPILTRLVTDPVVFGVFDIYTVVIRFATPIAVLGCYDAMFRLFFDDSDSQFHRQICSSSLAIVSSISVLILIVSLILYASDVAFADGYGWLIPIAGMVIASGAIREIIAAPSRMQNQRKRIILLSLLAPFVYYLIAMTLAWQGKPLEGLVYGNMVSSFIVLMIYGILNHAFFSPKAIKKEHIRGLLKMGIPLTPTFLTYWVFTSCDRFMLSRMIGLEAVGLYGIGARFSSISQGIYMAFAGGWQYFAFSTMKDEDHTRLMSHVFEVLGILSVASLFFLLPFVDWFFELIVGETYRKASVVFPFLFLSPLLLMLYQILGSQLLVVKKGYLSTVILSFGAVTNVVLNWVLIPRMGIKGAAIATLLGYVVSLALAFAIVKKMRLIYGSWRVNIIFGCGGLSLILANLQPNITIVISFVFLVLILAIYFSEIKKLIPSLWKMPLCKKE
ncbi:oligosaccharide flippase family protein [Acetomicrobium sp. S15 = DSM 107314]|uniref:oligosaccharide flippase family protein n=1 Tax=Acetomicrobium sp. S15 = DSM 107314 TaxID=2529858 RepID=UPI0018E0ED25|nr:oligosaccharide flippase family protein [Acetomicrobium sp. S15 = DSM 107314]